MKILGQTILLKPGADARRLEKIAEFLEERLAELQSKTQRAPGRETLLVYLALDLANELLQLKNNQEEARERVLALLAKIEKSF